MGVEASIEVRAAGGDRAAFTALMTATKADLSLTAEQAYERLIKGE